MEIIVDFTDGSHCTWLTQNHNAIDKMVAALIENLDKPWAEILIKISNKSTTT